MQVPCPPLSRQQSAGILPIWWAGNLSMLRFTVLLWTEFQNFHMLKDNFILFMKQKVLWGEHPRWGSCIFADNPLFADLCFLCCFCYCSPQRAFSLCSWCIISSIWASVRKASSALLWQRVYMGLYVFYHYFVVYFHAEAYHLFGCPGIQYFRYGS